LIRGLYSAAGSLQAAEQHHEVVAHNLAHANVPCYRRRIVVAESFDDALTRTATGEPRPGVGGQTTSVHTVFEPGDLQFTGNSLDLALRGDGFFVLRGPDGPVYTRSGVFQINGQGVLQSASGLPVSGGGGEITIPPGAAQLTVQSDGAVAADGAEIGRLELAHFKDPSVLVPVGTTLFQAPPGVRPEDGTSTVHQGYREGSNVAVVDELVGMIAGMRQYEASQRALRAISDAIEQNTHPQAG
jgi:flagellar basal body rod protein FlgG